MSERQHLNKSLEEAHHQLSYYYIFNLQSGEEHGDYLFGECLDLFAQLGGVKYRCEYLHRSQGYFEVLVTHKWKQESSEVAHALLQRCETSDLQIHVFLDLLNHL